MVCLLCTFKLFQDCKWNIKLTIAFAWHIFKLIVDVECGWIMDRI